MSLFSIRLTSIGAYSVHVKWSEPGQPNGLISHYRLVYKKHQQDPTLNLTAVVALTVEVNAQLGKNRLGTVSFMVFYVVSDTLLFLEYSYYRSFFLDDTIDLETITSRMYL